MLNLLYSLQSRYSTVRYRNVWQRLHVDYLLFISLLLLAGCGLLILYSASNQNTAMVLRQVIRLGLAFAVMMLFAQIPPTRYQKWAAWLYGGGIFLLISVLVLGYISKGAQRWLDLGLIRFQPSEIMKLATPMILASYLHERGATIPLRVAVIATGLILFPAFLVAKQPDLGTALLMISSGAAVLILAGLSWRLILGVLLLALMCSPFIWHFMHDYQRQRVLTFLNPERDPLGTGYHIIQSKIAIGSGGLLGKGWLKGTQSHLNFLPEHATDFIFAVWGEEFGLVGSFLLLLLYGFIILRCLIISLNAHDRFTRLLAGGLTVSFCVSVFVNIGMVTGILPVVGIPLPLISYGGTSMVTVLASFGILMSIQTHKKLFSTQDNYPRTHFVL